MITQNAPASTGIVPDFPEMSPTPAPDARDAPAPPEGASLNQRRLAPRSSNQFRVGPPFSATTAGARLVASGHKHVEPRISARLDRGFDMIDGEWIGYKRNYFTLVAAFQFVDLPPDATATESFSYVDGAGEPRPVRAFKILLTSVCLEDSSTAVTLVQHTAKRDRGPQSSPPLYYAVPGDLPAHSTMKLVANIRNGDKIDRCNRLFYLLKEDHQRAAESSPHCVLATYPRDCDISLVARYERIQFLSAGCGNRKLTSTNNKHYVLVVQLLGVTDLGLHVVLASSQSPPLIVRGRSPSNYPICEKKDSRLEKPEKPCARSSVAHLVIHEDAETEHDAENQACPKKRKTKPASKPPKPVLGSNQNILNSYTAEALDPMLLEGPRQAREGLRLPYDRAPSAVPQMIPPLDDRLCLPDHGYASPENISPGFVIAQENLLPFLDDSPNLGSSFLFMSGDAEPMNINHTPFQSSQERLHRAMQEYENTTIELEDFIDADLANPYECYLSLPVPIVFPETIRTSTPLQLHVMDHPVAMRPNLMRNLHPPIARCKHGFKQRDNTRQTTRREKLYTYADLSDSGISDSSFRVFKDKLDSYKPRIRNQSLHTSSLRLSPLTMLSSDHEVLILNGIRHCSDNDGNG